MMQKEKAMLCPDLGIQTDDTALFCPNAEQGPVPFADRRRSDAGLAGQFRLCHTQLAKLCRQSNLNRNRQPHPAPTQERGENDLGSCDISSPPAKLYQVNNSRFYQRRAQRLSITGFADTKY